jgi:hypothetical protein
VKTAKRGGSKNGTIDGLTVKPKKADVPAGQLPPFLKAELDTLAEKSGTSPAECLRRMIESEMDRMKLGKACATVQIRLTPAQYAAALACSIVYAEGDLEKYTQSLVMVGIEGDIDSVASELRASLKESRNEG